MFFLRAGGLGVNEVYGVFCKFGCLGFGFLGLGGCGALGVLGL